MSAQISKSRKLGQLKSDDPVADAESASSYEIEFVGSKTFYMMQIDLIKMKNKFMPSHEENLLRIKELLKIATC